MKASRDYNKKAKGLDKAAYGSNALKRTYGRIQAGTFGSTGRYGQKSRAAELAEAGNNAEFEVKSDFSKLGITDFAQQNEYMEALGAGRRQARLTIRDANGNITGHRMVDVKGYNSASKRISAAKTIVERGESDHLRRAWGDMDEQIRAGVNDTHGAKIAEMANDLSGRSSWSLGEKQLATQDDETLRNWAAEFDDIQERTLATQAAGMAANPDDIEHIQTMREAAARAIAPNSGIQLSANQRLHLQWVAQGGADGGAGPRPHADRDYAGRRANDPGYDHARQHLRAG